MIQIRNKQMGKKDKRRMPDVHYASWGVGGGTCSLPHSPTLLFFFFWRKHNIHTAIASATLKFLPQI